MGRWLYRCAMTQKQLCAWRHRRGFTQAELARILGVSRWTIVSWEGGRRDIPDMVPKALMGLELVESKKAQANRG